MARIKPNMPVSCYKSYEIRTVRSTQTRPATCEEVDCEHYLHGWVTRVPVGSEWEHLLQQSGRHWAARTVDDAGIVSYAFEPGTPCFKAEQHRVRIALPLYIVRDGDWRGNPTGNSRAHANIRDWADDFATHQDRINTLIARG